MELKKPDRATLKSYFVKNAVPSSGDFAQLIDGQLNQREDGIAKPPGEPLSLQADGEERKALNFYRSFGDTGPAWTLSLNPRVAPGQPDTRPGWSLGEAAGSSRLFVEQGTGNVGVGTLDTGGAKLRVAGSLKAASNASGERPLLMEAPGNANHRGVGTQAATGLVYRAASNPAAGEPIFQVRSEGQAVRFFVEHDGWTGSRDNAAWFGGTAKPSYFAGSVGVGAAEPVAKLEVNGAVAINAGKTAAITKERALMAAGSLTIGSVDADYGGGTAQWNANTAGLLLEAKDKTEIAVHDSGNRVASLLYYEGGTTNRITIGRNMGWEAVGQVLIPSTLKAKAVRVTHYSASVTKDTALSKANTWNDFPELLVRFELAQESEVAVFYGITMGGGGGTGDNSHLCTTLVRNDAELPQARSIAGNCNYWSPSGAWAGTLAAGSYTFKVRYRTPQGGTLVPRWDWNKGVLTATVYGAG